jgi:hypothetical protein
MLRLRVQQFLSLPTHITKLKLRFLVRHLPPVMKKTFAEIAGIV